jgi:hypothetical protein
VFTSHRITPAITSVIKIVRMGIKESLSEYGKDDPLQANRHYIPGRKDYIIHTFSMVQGYPKKTPVETGVLTCEIFNVLI